LAKRRNSIGKEGGGRGRTLPALATLLCLAICGSGAAVALAGPSATRVVYAKGRIVPIPAQIPHEPGDMIDRRIIPDLRWIAQRFPIYVTDGYSGPLPGGGHAGCHGCHVNRSDHHYGLAVDIVAQRWSARCDAAWRPITRLARWAEPRPNRPVPPFRWVGYDGDAGHGCGHHLHLSWNHAPGPQFQPAEWVEVFRTAAGSGVPGGGRQVPSRIGPSGGIRSLPSPTGGIGRGD
jgi:hypothetical protein